MRVSNFLLWQIAYAEIWVTDTLWPDFRARHLFEAIVDFQKRERRYGGVGSTGESDLAGEAARPKSAAVRDAVLLRRPAAGGPRHRLVPGPSTPRS